MSTVNLTILTIMFVLSSFAQFRWLVPPQESQVRLGQGNDNRQLCLGVPDTLGFGPITDTYSDLLMLGGWYARCPMLQHCSNSSEPARIAAVRFSMSQISHSLLMFSSAEILPETLAYVALISVLMWLRSDFMLYSFSS